ncbi:MAG: hypothetical protein WC683_01875 [bacterium]
MDDKMTREIVMGERDGILAFLRRKATDCRNMASNALADSMQNRPNAERWEERAKVLDETAEQIAGEWHWQ